MSAEIRDTSGHDAVKEIHQAWASYGPTHCLTRQSKRCQVRYLAGVGGESELPDGVLLMNRIESFTRRIDETPEQGIPGIGESRAVHL